MEIAKFLSIGAIRACCHFENGDHRLRTDAEVGCVTGARGGKERLELDVWYLRGLIEWLASQCSIETLKRNVQQQRISVEGSRRGSVRNVSILAVPQRSYRSSRSDFSIRKALAS